MEYIKEYRRWVERELDDELNEVLESMNDNEIEDCFYRNLSFGTGGLRGIIGPGTNRINVYTVAKASQGLANYLLRIYDNPSVVIGYDSRIKSDLFAKTSASVFAENGIEVYLWRNLNPVPTVSYATRFLRCSAGVMITASHNPSKYNGYKVYGHDGCQITTNDADLILEEIESLDIFRDIKRGNFDDLVEKGAISFVSDAVLDSFIDEVKKQSVLFGEEINKDVAIVYSPLNGTGYIPVTRVLRESGFTNITLVEEQRLPDGHFPTCPYPNPEVNEAMSLGIEYAKNKQADLLLATDPDCDRVGVAVKDKEDKFALLTGNEIGLLLLDYICAQRIKHNRMPTAPVLVKTIVTSDLAEKIASHYGVRTFNVLTGFKYIGEQIGLLEKNDNDCNYIFGFEESYGYLSGTYVRDKDGVNGAYLICEMFAYYKTNGISLIDKLDELYEVYGYQINTLQSYEFEGLSGFIKMNEIMSLFRNNSFTQFGSKKVINRLDYGAGIDGLPRSDVLKFVLEDNCFVVIRPSGTEPKLKIYISSNGIDKEQSINLNNAIDEDIRKIFI